MVADYPSLVSTDGSNMKFDIKFLNHSGKIKDILCLGGGASPLASFVGKFSIRKKRYSAWSPKFPIIILTDNDKGAECVFKSIETVSKSTPSIEDDKSFYHINNNLYLVKIPHIGNESSVDIEDIFEEKWLKLKIDKKIFSRKNEYDNKTHYGIVDFAKKVIAKNFNLVNFNEFCPLLDRLVAVQDHFNS